MALKIPVSGARSRHPGTQRGIRSMQLPKRRFAVLFRTMTRMPNGGMPKGILLWGLSLLAALAWHPALAQAPRPWEMNMQPAFSPMKREIIDLHNLVLVLITIITLFVAALLVWV